MSIFFIARDNIKKKKGNAILLFILIIFAVMMLYVGISVLSNMEKVIDQRNEATNGADYQLSTSSKYVDDIDTLFNKDSQVTYWEKEKCTSVSAVKFHKSDEEEKEVNQVDFTFLKRDVDREVSLTLLIDEGEKWNDDSIILPYYMKVGMGYNTGDEICLNINNKNYTFKIYGFLEDIMYSTPTNNTEEKCFVTDKKYDEILSDYKTERTMYRVKLVTGTDTEQFESDMNTVLKQEIPDYLQATNQTLNYKTMKYGTSVTANLCMSILTVFSILLILIALIIIYYNVNHSIEMNMKNIGMLEATGYTSRQLKYSTMLEILMISTASIVFGLLGAVVLSGIVGNILSAAIGLRWMMGFDTLSALVAIVITLSLVMLAARISSLKYNKISPLDAMRDGIRTHNFRKNHVPLEHTPLPLNMSLGIKNIFVSKKKNIIIFFIIILLTFSGYTGICLYQNFGSKDNSNLLNITGFEVADVMVVVRANERQTVNDNIEHAKKTALDCNSVNQVLEYSCYDMTCSSDSETVGLSCDIFDQTDRLRNDNVVSGRRPTHDNEVMLTTLMAEKLSVNIDDVVYLNIGGENVHFIVSGLCQGINHLGKKAMITKEGMARINSEVVPNVLYIYAKDAKSIDGIVSQLRNNLDTKIYSINNYQDYVGVAMASVQSVLNVLCLVMIVTVMIVIAIVMTLLVKTQITRDNRQYGIYKALGYTTGQLIRQLTINYMPVVGLGLIMGCIFTWFAVNPAFIVCLSMFGIKKCTLTIQIPVMILYAAGVLVWAEVIVILCSLRIKRIEPQKMIQEN
jgi:putative ABC transport system permease protein